MREGRVGREGMAVFRLAAGAERKGEEDGGSWPGRGFGRGTGRPGFSAGLVCRKIGGFGRIEELADPVRHTGGETFPRSGERPAGTAAARAPSAG